MFLLQNNTIKYNTIKYMQSILYHRPLTPRSLRCMDNTSQYKKDNTVKYNKVHVFNTVSYASYPKISEVHGKSYFYEAEGGGRADLGEQSDQYRWYPQKYARWRLLHVLYG